MTVGEGAHQFVVSAHQFVDSLLCAAHRRHSMRSMKKLILTALLVLALPAASRAQNTADRATARDAVTRASLDYLEGFYEGDTAKLVRSIRPEVYKYGFDWLKDKARYEGERMTWGEILGYARRFKANNRQTPPTAPKKVELLDVLDQTAAAKVTAWWGTDYLLLARFDGRWMITHVLWQSPTP
jgi:hypothetical protein